MLTRSLRDAASVRLSIIVLVGIVSVCSYSFSKHNSRTLRVEIEEAAGSGQDVDTETGDEEAHQSETGELRLTEDSRPSEEVEARETSADENVEEEQPKKPTEKERAPRSRPTGKEHSVYVVPVQDTISKPTLYIVRRGIKEAINNDVDVIVLDMDTPGGRVDVTLEIMEILDRFQGETVTYVNVDAISAGAFIASATDEIYFAPKSQIGAAAVIFGTGDDVPETAKQKIESYMGAKVRNYSETDPYRAKVIKAMMDADYVLEIEGEVIKPEGELLTLTAAEAVKEYGDPPRPLLGAGIAGTLEDLLDQKYGDGNYVIKEFDLTWSETLAQYMDAIAPILLGIGFLCMMIEFKTPGFGFIGGIGIAFLLTVFASNYVAGLAGYEAILFFLLGIILIGIELFLLPGTVFPAFLGIVLILGSLIWSMADIWPDGGNGIEFDPEVLWQPIYNLALGILISIFGGVAVWRFLPTSWIYDKLVLAGSVAAADPLTAGGASSLSNESSLPDVGSEGIAASDLHPMGEVDIGGRRYQATLSLGTVRRGAMIKVVGYKNFALLVDSLES